MKLLALFLLAASPAIYGYANEEVLTIPAYAMPRASDEAKLMGLLHEDIEDAHMAHVDLRLRKEINHLASKISNEY